MDFLDRLKNIMEKNHDNNSTLAKKSGIPYTTVVGLFKRGWETAQLTTIQRICEYYSVSIDFMVYGVEKLSEESQMIAAKYDTLDESGKELLNIVADLQVKRMKETTAQKSRRVPIIGNAYNDGRFETKLAAMQEQKEMVEDIVEINE